MCNNLTIRIFLLTFITINKCFFDNTCKIRYTFVNPSFLHELENHKEPI